MPICGYLLKMMKCRSADYCKRRRGTTQVGHVFVVESGYPGLGDGLARADSTTAIGTAAADFRPTALFHSLHDDTPVVRTMFSVSSRL